MLTLAMPQSLPAVAEEVLGLQHVVGEDRRAQALRDVVVERDGLAFDFIDGRHPGSLFCTFAVPMM